MTDENVIKTVEGLDALTPGEWVIDADGDALCLVDTYLGWPQRMWMPKAKKGRVGLVVSLGHATFPVALAKIDPEYVCKHGRGTNECGHCYVCGAVVGERSERHFDAETMAVVREAGRMNAAYDEAHRASVQGPEVQAPDDCSCEDREALVRPEGLVCGTCGKVIDPDWEARS
uniref:hypothetical protein n=1 Tax=Microbacterium proteolyticum TaxID=1572644 RepID=UPI002416EDFD|nr:hypothetical protein [Microbacterium proteolyticum]